ncbi:MAG: hypothetical protein JSU61_08395 [Fidelibacterota bacterium]|nr:MAG: hypothetical protein JSU61_08395 [Candidatus Neomarinimicrobiota bacterium]
MSVRNILPLAACVSLLWGQSFPVDVMRQAYRHSLEDVGYARQWYAELSSSRQSSTDALTMGYLGAQQAVLAKHNPLPWRKLHFLRQADTTMAQALALSGGHPEIHFLRFSYQHNVPGFLGFSAELESDRLLLVNYLAAPPDSLIEQDVMGDMAAFLIESGRCTPQEIQRLQAVIP